MHRAGWDHYILFQLSGSIKLTSDWRVSIPISQSCILRSDLIYMYVSDVSVYVLFQKSKTLPKCQMRPRTSCECPCNKYSNILICNEDRRYVRHCVWFYIVAVRSAVCRNCILCMPRNFVTLLLEHIFIS